MDNPDYEKSKIFKSTNFILRAAQNALLNKSSDGLATKKAEAIRHLQLAGIFYNGIAHK